MAGEGTHHRHVVVCAVLAIAGLVGACGSGSDDEPVAQDPPDSAVVSTDAGSGDTVLTTAQAADSTVGTTAVPPKHLSDDVLPGTAFDLFPYEGARLTVVGVAVDDVLNVRVGPGPEFDVVTTLAPTSSGDAVATGRNRDVESGIWAEIEMGDIVGWANTTYLLQAGSVTDDTHNLFETAADHPVGSFPETMARRVAGAYASLEPDSTVTVVDGPREGDLTSVIVDVIGLGDDAIGGYRLHVFFEQVEDGYRVRTVETTTLCTRGVEGGVCA